MRDWRRLREQVVRQVHYQAYIESETSRLLGRFLEPRSSQSASSLTTTASSPPADHSIFEAPMAKNTSPVRGHAQGEAVRHEIADKRYEAAEQERGRA
jgi:hypothetical protein